MYCDFSAPFLLLFSADVPSLLYYSHLPTALFAIIFGIFVFISNRQGTSNKLLLVITVLFGLLNILNLIAWVNIDSRIVIVAWLLLQIIYLSVPIATLCLYQVFVHDRGLTLLEKAICLIVIGLFSISVAFGFTMSHFNLIDCELVETTFLQIYQSVVFAFVFLLILFSFAKALKNNHKKEDRKRILIFTAGTLLFLTLLVFTWQIASIIDNFELEQYGLFGMVIFLAFLGYLIVRYRAFDIKMVGAQALILALVIITGSQFFYAKTSTDITLDAISFFLVLTAGYYLIKSVKQEVKRKEELEVLSKDLAKANEKLTEMDKQKSEFISIASHQLRTPLTAIKGYVSLLLEGSYGVLNKDVNDVLNKIYSVNDRLAHLVEDLLNVSRIEAGRIQYNFQPTQLADILTELHDMFSMPAKSKGLEFKLNLPKPALPMVTADPNKIKEITSNLIDNAIKYTPSGSVTVSLSQEGKNARIVIADTGIGIKPEDKEHLFTKFVRSKETSRMVVSGAGLGLFVGKSFILAHKGNVWAESDGPGKGSKFIIELPLENPDLQVGTIELAKKQ